MNINQLLNTVLLNETEEINESYKTLGSMDSRNKPEGTKPKSVLNNMDGRDKPTSGDLVSDSEILNNMDGRESKESSSTGGKSLSTAAKAGLYGTAGLGAGLGALYLAKKLREKRAAKKAKK